MKDWKNNIRKIEPYVPGEQPNVPGMIKINTNENPYPPAPGVIKAIADFNADELKLYPDPTVGPLVEVLADYYGLDHNQVFVGVGSDDVLAVAFMTFFNFSKPILFPNITYSFYDVWAELYRIPYETPALTADFRIRAADYYKENGGVVLANPNAPTSICENLAFIRDILDHNHDVIVIVDEAYIDFGGDSALSLIAEYDNLLVVQTFSKSRSMAGMRIGYAMGNPELIQAMNDVKYSINSYTMNLTSMKLGVEAVKDKAYFEATLEKIVATRERAKERFKEMGFSFPDSQTNFLFVTHDSIPAKELFEMLREKKIYVRYFGRPGIHNYLRITIGTEEEMDYVCKVLGEYINSQK